jgi:hypothetical protein
MTKLDNYADRFLSYLYGAETYENGERWEDVYADTWYWMCYDFSEYVQFCKEYKYFPSLMDFTYFLMYLEYDHIGNFNIEDFKDRKYTFLDLALEMHNDLIKYLANKGENDED